MLIVVAGSSGFGEVIGVASTRPTDLLEQLPRQVGHVLYLVPEELQTSAREQAHVVVAARPQTRVCVLPARHHALTLTLIGAVLVEAEGAPNGWVDPGEAVQLAEQAIARSRSLVWHPRAVGLRQPEPSTGQRLASLVRRPGYLSEVGVAESLVPARQGVSVRADESLCVAGPLPALLLSQLGSTPHAVVQVESTTARPYAIRGSVELSGLVRPDRPAHPSPLCASCTAQMIGGRCAFCGVGPRDGSNDSGRSSRRAPVPAKADWEGRAA